MPLKIPGLSLLKSDTFKKMVIEGALLAGAGVVCVVISTVLVNRMPLSKGGAEMPASEKPAKAEKAKPAESSAEKPAAKSADEHSKDDNSTQYPLKPVIVNLADTTARRYAKVSLALEVKTPSVKDDLAAHEAQVYDTLIKVIGNYHFDEISSSAGKEALKEEVKNRLNLFLSDGIASVYLTELIVQ